MFRMMSNVTTIVFIALAGCNRCVNDSSIIQEALNDPD